MTESICFDLETFRRRAESQRHLLVELGSPPAEARGGLGAFVASKIEARLRDCGALPRSGVVPMKWPELLSDQLYRARLLGREGLALAFDSLDPIAPEGVLSSDDSSALRSWVDAANDVPLLLGLSEAVRELRVYSDPVAITSWFRRSPELEVARDVGKDAGGEEATAEQEGTEQETEQELATPAAAPIMPEASPDHVITRRRSPAEPLCARQGTLFVESGDDGASSEPSDAVTRSQQMAAHADALSNVCGAQTWASLEATFVTEYVPLRSALLERPGHAFLHEALADWASQFEECYRRAFARVLGSRTRPLMIFDAPKIAFRLARAEQSKGFQLVLVDALRFDLGQRAFEKLRLQLSGFAECVERGVLWAPLPSTTSASLELLARGADGLRDIGSELREVDVLSIKEARRLRKLRAGAHSLFKLDAVQAHLEPDKAWDDQGLGRLAAEVAVSVGRFVKQQPPGTLVVLFGDHGFRLDDGGFGGASPEEVLVPYQAWHVPDVAKASALLA